MDEAADSSPRVFSEILRPALADRKGWGVWIGSAKGMNDFHDLWQAAKADPERYFALMLRASQTGIVPQEELDDARRAMTPEQYLQEFECSFQAAIIGAYYGKELQQAEDDGRIADGVYDPDTPSIQHGTWASQTTPSSGSRRSSAIKSASSTAMQPTATDSTTTPASCRTNATDTAGTTSRTM